MSNNIRVAYNFFFLHLLLEEKNKFNWVHATHKIRKITNENYNAHMFLREGNKLYYKNLQKHINTKNLRIFSLCV